MAKANVDVSKMSVEELEQLLAAKKQERQAELMKNLEPRKAKYLTQKTELEKELAEIQQLDASFELAKVVLNPVSLSSQIKKYVKANPGSSFEKIALETQLPEADVIEMVEKNMRKSKPNFTKDVKGNLSFIPKA